MNCNHQFLHLGNTQSFDEKNDLTVHATAVCVYCGQVRHVSSDGIVRIVKDHGEIRKQNLS